MQTVVLSSYQSMPALHSYLRTRLNSSYQSISPVRMTSLLVTEPEMHKKPRSKTKMKENLKAVREDMQMEDHMLDLDDLEVKLGTCLKTVSSPDLFRCSNVSRLFIYLFCGLSLGQGGEPDRNRSNSFILSRFGDLDCRALTL